MRFIVLTRTRTHNAKCDLAHTSANSKKGNFVSANMTFGGVRRAPPHRRNAAEDVPITEIVTEGLPRASAVAHPAQHPLAHVKGHQSNTTATVSDLSPLAIVLLCAGAAVFLWTLLTSGKPEKQTVHF